MIYVDIISLLIAAAALVWAIRTEIKRQKEKLHRQQRFEWTHIQQGVRQMCAKLRRQLFVPEALIAVPGAGLILTELALMEFDEYTPVLMLQQLPLKSDKTFIGNGVEVKTPNWRYFIPNEVLTLTNKRVLIFDDYAVGGATLYEIKKCLLQHGINVKTIALIGAENLEGANMRPDDVFFTAHTYDVYMPWGHADKTVRVGRTLTAKDAAGAP